jgi:hypothetical protein
MAAVQLASATAGDPMRLSKACSNVARFGPTVDNQLVENA